MVKVTTSTLTVNVTDVLRYVNIIEEETGSYPSFNLTITPRITESFNIAGRPIRSIYSPALTMEFIVGNRNGVYISMHNMTQSEVKIINDQLTTHNEAVSNQRIMWPIGALLR
jgi:hypothetical protein